jgi:hypothetical protein
MTKTRSTLRRRLLSWLAVGAAIQIVVLAGVPPALAARANMLSPFKVSGPYKAQLGAASCVGTGRKVDCAIVGTPYGLYSTNDGRTWSKSRVPGAAKTLDEVQCLGTTAGVQCLATGVPQTGLDPPGYVAYSKDGGATWAVPAGGAGTVPPSDFSCAASRGEMDCVILNTNGVEYSRDGGASWGASPAVANGGFVSRFSRDDLSVVSCAPSRTSVDCVAAGNVGYLLVLYSTDGGATWSPAGASSADTEGAAPTGLSCTTAGRGVDCVITAGEPLKAAVGFYSPDGGDLWADTSGPIGSGVSCVGDRAVQCASGGYYSSDGGARWAPAKVPPSSASELEYETCVAAPAGPSCYSTGSSGDIYFSGTGGATWSILRAPRGLTSAGYMSCSVSLVCAVPAVKLAAVGSGARSEVYVLSEAG